MRTYPNNIKELVEKHDFILPINKNSEELLIKNIILRHDLAFLFLKERIFKVFSKLKETNNSITLESKIEQVIGNKRRKEIYNSIRKEIPFYTEGLKRSFIYYLIILLVFLTPSIVFLIMTIKDETLFAFSLLHTDIYAIIISISGLLAFGFDFIVGRFIPKQTIPTEYQDLNIKDFIGKIINDNREKIKEKFFEIFKRDIEKTQILE